MKNRQRKPKAPVGGGRQGGWEAGGYSIQCMVLFRKGDHIQGTAKITSHLHFIEGVRAQGERSGMPKDV